MNNMHITFTKASNKSDVKESGKINILYHQIRGEAKKPVSMLVKLVPSSPFFLLPPPLPV